MVSIRGEGIARSRSLDTVDTMTRRPVTINLFRVGAPTARLVTFARLVPSRRDVNILVFLVLALRALLTLLALDVAMFHVHEEDSATFLQIQHVVAFKTAAEIREFVTCVLAVLADPSMLMFEGFDVEGFIHLGLVADFLKAV
jgi:hypothetical protein